MAGGNCDSFNNKQLWQLVSGTGFLRPETYVKFELDNSKAKILNGISFYKKRVPSKGEALKKERKLTESQNEFVLKLSQLLCLDEFQSHDLFCAFLFGEFRGSQKELKNILSSERHSQTLLLKIRDFYYSERLYLLRCLRQMIVSWVEDQHAYKDVFDGFLKSLLENNLLGKKLLGQWDEVCNTPIPDKENSGPLMTQGLVMSWAVHSLKEQTELLELLLIYYKYIEMDADTLLSLCEKFKKHLFGWGQSFKHLVNKELAVTIQRIGYLEVILLLESFDLTSALDALKDESSTDQHVILGNKGIMEKVNKVMTKLGSEPIHGPLLLGWAVLQYVYAQTNQGGDNPGGPSSEDREEMVHKAQAGFQHFGNVALQLSVFETLATLIETDPFCGKTHLAFIVHSTVFYVVSALLSIFHEDSLGNSDALYRIAAKLLQWEAIADMVWKDSTEGLATLVESSKHLFPLDFACFLKFSISLARAGPSSVKQLKACLSRMKGYTEPLDCNRAQDLETTPQQNVFLLRRHKHPMESSDFVIERGCRGELLDVTTLRSGLATYNHVIQWDVKYNGWQLLLGQIQELLAQVSHGAGLVQTEQLLKVTLVMELVKEVMTSDPSSIPEFNEIISLCYQLIVRFAVLSPAPLELLGHTIQCLALATPHMPLEVMHHLKQTGLLPFLTENIDDFEEVLTGDGINQGLYGNVLASTECPQGVYLVTIAVLELVTQLVVSSSSSSSRKVSTASSRHPGGPVVGGYNQLSSSEHLASVLFILRDVFPVFHKWRFVDLKHRKLIGQKCLQLFHKVLNFSDLPLTSGTGSQMEEEMDSDETRILSTSSASLASYLGLQSSTSSFSSSLSSLSKQVPKKKGPNLKECCVFSLLFTGAGRALLDIVATGVDTVQMALAQQRSMNEGPGVDLVELIEMSLSLLNRLLLLKPPNLGVSPVESALSSQPPGQQHQQRHLVSVIAQYIYHRHSHRLPALATILLKRLAMVSPMSILACLGNDADAIRDMYLTRLQAVSEDIQLKVGILELLAVCVECQPGLIEIFLNVVSTQHSHQQKQRHKSGQTVKESTLASGEGNKPELTLGNGSCLPIVLDLLAVDKQCTYQCPPRLLSSGLAFLHTLWQAMRETPMTVLRERKSFWPSVLSPLKLDLPELDPQDPNSMQAYKLKTKILSYSLRISALEIFATSSTKLDTNFKATLQSVFANSRLQYWSEVVKSSLKSAAQQDNSDSLDNNDVTDLPTALVLLQAWKNIITTSARFKVAEVGLTDKLKARILHDLLAGITEQFRVGEMTQLKVKVASVASALYFTLVNMWGKELFPALLEEFAASARTISEPSAIMKGLVRLVEESCMTCDKLLPSVHIGVMAAILSILQQCGNKLDSLSDHLSSLLPVVCSVFHQSTRQLTTLIQTTTASNSSSNNNSTTKTTSSSSPDEGETPQSKALAGHIKLQIVSLCLLLETLQLSSDVDATIKVIQGQDIVPSLLATTQAFMTGKQGISYIYSSLLLMTKMAESEVGASLLLMNNLTSHLCMALTSCYSNDDSSNQGCTSLQKVFSSLRPNTVTWHTLYCLTLDLFASMLRVLKHAFLESALNLVGVHQERMQMALIQAQVNLTPALMKEAESTCNVFSQLAAYQRQWKFMLPDVLNMLRDALVSMLQTYAALIIRPRYLMHILGHGKGSDGSSKTDAMMQTSSLLQQQTSLDDVEQPSTRLVETQHRMLVIISKALSCLRQFSPNLTEIMMDQSVDVTEWDPILDIAFNTPSLDGPLATGVTFGTLLYLNFLCVRQLGKSDNRSSSPHRLSPSPLDASKTTTATSANSVPRSIIQHVLEASLDLLMSQACRYLRDHNLSPRDRQYLKRELGTEMNLFLSGYQRQFRRGVSPCVTPPQSSQPLSSIVPPTNSQTPQPLNRTLSTTSFNTAQEPGYVRLAQAFVQQVLR